MNYTVERTDDAVTIRFPKATNDASLLSALEYLEYSSLARKSTASDSEIDAILKSVKRGVWERTKERLRDEPGFEWIDEEA